MKQTLLALSVLMPIFAHAEDARMNYTSANGETVRLGMAVPVCGVDANGVPQVCQQPAEPDLSGYLTKSDASSTYAPLATLSSYATTNQLATVQSGIPAAVSSALNGFEGSVTGDVSAAGGQHNACSS